MKYRKSIVLGGIYIGGRFLGFRGRKATQRLPKVAQVSFLVALNITLCSLDVDISAVRTTVSDKGLERHAIRGTRDRIVCCVASRLNNLRSTTERNGQEQRQAR